MVEDRSNFLRVKRNTDTNKKILKKTHLCKIITQNPKYRILDIAKKLKKNKIREYMVKNTITSL